jgi:predicted transcriptional regulator
MNQEREAKWARFEAEIQKGVDSADRGELYDADDVFEPLERKYRSMAKRDAE